MGGDGNGRVPVEAILHFAGWKSEWNGRIRLDIARLPLILIELGDEALVAAGVDVFGVLAIEGDIGAFAAADGVPVFPTDTGSTDAARDADAGVVLLSAVDPVRKTVVGVDAVELGGGLIFRGGPGDSTVIGDIGAAVVRINHDIRIRWVEPEVVVVTVRSAVFGEGLATVDGLVDASVQDPDYIWILGIGEDFHVIPGAGLEGPTRVDESPGFAGVVGAIDPAVGVGFDDCVNTIWIGGDIHADFAQGFGKPGGDFLPIVAAVGGFPDARAGAAAAHLPGVTNVIPEGGIEDAGVGGVDGEFAAAGVFVETGEEEVPGFAAVFAAVDAAVFGGAVWGTLGGDVDEVGVGGMDADACNGTGFGEAEVFPGAAGVGGFIDAIAVGGGDAADGVLAHADVDDVGVGRGDGDSADGRGFDEAIGDVAPGFAGVVRFVDASASGAEVVREGVVGDSGDGDGAAAAEGSDVAPFHGGEWGDLGVERERERG